MKRITRSIRYAAIGIVGVAIFSALHAGRSSSSELTTTGLANQTHFHGIAVDAANPSRIYLATHHGLYGVSADGKARPISDTRDDFMGFTTHPGDPAILLASGHPANGGNLGFVASKDGGKTWEKIANGVNGPVD